ncbi:MAG TPA: siderophore-interacting protein [Clostridium sp.]|nr:siderophore-interacting protein [Clostridium sp.]
MTNEELVKLYQLGDKQALEQLIEKNKGIVIKLVNKYYIDKTSSINREDLDQEGMIGLIIAANKYDLNNPKKASFITYAVFWVNQRLNRFVRQRNTNNEISLNKRIGEDEDTELGDFIEGVDYSFENVEDKIYRQQLRQELEEVMNKYNTLKEREILKLHYGWGNNRCMNLSEIAELYQVTRASIYNVELIALSKIRRSPWGAKKAKEIYNQKKSRAAYSIPGIIESISFGQRYLGSEVIL